MGVTRNILFFLVALQILNIGLFAQDIPILALQNQTQNQINSVAEYIAEVSFGIKDAFPENQHQNRTNKHSSNTSFHIKVLQFHLFKPQSNYFTISSDSLLIIILHGWLLEKKFQNFITETTSPPPKYLV